MLGDDRQGTARALLRIVESGVFADKTGLIMQLKVAANVVLRADKDIQDLDLKLKMSEVAVEALKKHRDQVSMEWDRLRKILARVPGSIVIKAKEEAGFGDEIKLN